MILIVLVVVHLAGFQEQSPLCSYGADVQQFFTTTLSKQYKSYSFFKLLWSVFI